MKTETQSQSSRKIQQLTSAQVSATVERSSLTRQEFAAQVGCGTSQLFKYQQEGLPPRMDKLVRANIVRAAMELGVIPQNAAARAEIEKLSKGHGDERQPKRR